MMMMETMRKEDDEAMKMTSGDEGDGAMERKEDEGDE